MKKLLGLLLLCVSVGANAQFTPGQLLTAAELNNQFALYAPLGGAVFTGPITATATTQGRLDNSTSLATDQFVNQQGASAVATVPFAGVTGGIYNQATLGTGCQIVVFASGGVVTSSLTISNPGSGYAVGDLLALPAGNSDAVLRVTGVSGGGVTSVGIAYGGTGYTTGNQVTAMAVPPGRRAVNFTGTLTSNLTFIIQNGTFLTASREVEFLNNTTGAFTITVKLSNGAGGSTGTGVVLPQGTNNSTALTVYTDGVNDVWLSNVPVAPGTVPLSSLAAQAANTVVANATAGSASPTAVAIPSCSTTTSALNWTSGAGFSCGGSGFAPLASPTFTGVPAAPTAALATNTTQIATTAFVLANAVTSSSPTITTPNIIGVSNGSNAAAGSMGEVLSAQTLATSATSGTTLNATSVSLTAGDWDVTGVVRSSPAGSTVISQQAVGISTTSATLGVFGTFSNLTIPFPAGSGASIPAPTVRISISATTTVYLVTTQVFSTSTLTVDGAIRARRIR